MRAVTCSLCCLAILLFALPALSAQDTLPPSGWQKADTPEVRIEKGLSLIVQGDMEDAFKTLFGKGHTKEVLDKLKFELYTLTKKYGNAFGYEKLIQQKAGTSALRYRYLLMYDKQPVLFDFYYYKGKKGWFLKNISYSKDIKKVFVR